MLNTRLFIAFSHTTHQITTPLLHELILCARENYAETANRFANVLYFHIQFTHSRMNFQCNQCNTRMLFY